MPCCGTRAGSSSASGPGRPFSIAPSLVGQTLLVSGPVRFYHGRQMAPREYVILADADSEAEPLTGGKVLPVYPATEGLSHKVIRSLIDRHLDSLIALSHDVCPRRCGRVSRCPLCPRRCGRYIGPALAGGGGARAGGGWPSTSCSISS